MNDITGREFAHRAEDLIGLSYQQCDCIGVVRKALGVRIQGTNWLWRSVNNSAKYRYLVERQSFSPDTNNPNIEDGLVVFRIKWDEIPSGYTDKPNAHHVGVLIFKNGKWSVIQSNSKTGVCLSDYHPVQWDGYGKMKFVQYMTNRPEVDEPAEENRPEVELTDHEMIKAIYYKIIEGD